MVALDKRILDYRPEILADAQLFIAETKPDVSAGEVGTLSLSLSLSTLCLCGLSLYTSLYLCLCLSLSLYFSVVLVRRCFKGQIYLQAKFKNLKRKGLV